jgi:Fe-S-cluster-containing hydrogenase component 2
MLQFTVNETRCVRCSQCVRDCPVRIITREGKAVPQIAPEAEVQCLQCQHCLAVCPMGAISILGRNPDLSLPLPPESLPSFEQMTRLVRGRRSVRQYRDENVDPALFQQLLATLANAPSGLNRRELTFHVIDDKAVMQRFRQKTMDDLRRAEVAGNIPEQFAYLKQLIPVWFEHRVDVIFRGAPHALIISAPATAPCPQEDIALALAYFELLARTAGLGTVWWGLLKLVLLTLPELKQTLGLPADDLYYAMLFGLPAVRHPRTVQRDDAAVVRRVPMP